jgi:hypothetical protein
MAARGDGEGLSGGPEGVAKEVRMAGSTRRLLFLLLSLVAMTPVLDGGLRAQGTDFPVGAWDFVLGDRQRGVAHVTFSGDGTLAGLAVLTSGGRSLIKTNDGFSYTNLYGAVNVTGSWVREPSGRLSGFLSFVGASTTNGLSFRGKGSGSRLLLQAFGTPGRITFRGVPMVETNEVELADGAPYLGTLRYRKVPFPVLEVFELAEAGPLAYELSGGGPGYDYTGWLLLSSQRQAAMFQDRGAGTGRPRIAAYAGGFNVRTRRGAWLGTDGVNTAVRYRVAPGQAEAAEGGN